MRKPTIVREPAQEDAETKRRRQLDWELRQIERAHDNRALVEMNGAKCAGHQIFDLMVYDRPQRNLVGGGR